HRTGVAAPCALSGTTVSRSLLIETSSGKSGHVALAESETLLSVRRLDESRRHARDLAPALQALLAEAGWTPRDINAVLVSVGPGSSTGLRVGVMSAKIFAYATGCAILGIEAFAAVARQAPAECARLDVLADAQQDKIYVQPFGRDGSEWLAQAPLAIRRVADWLAEREPSAWGSGPGLGRGGRT